MERSPRDNAAESAANGATLRSDTTGSQPRAHQSRPRVRFRLNWDKAIEAVVWLAKKKPQIGPFYIAKVLYFADKAHLQKYGRPILGDTYIAMEHGPVPSGVQDMLTQNTFLDPDILQKSSDAISINNASPPQISAVRPPNLALFSGTDIECLEEAFAKYSKMPFSKLRNLTHKERAWLEAQRNGEMNYEDMIGDVPDRDELIEQIRETAPYMVF